MTVIQALQFVFALLFVFGWYHNTFDSDEVDEKKMKHKCNKILKYINIAVLLLLPLVALIIMASFFGSDKINSDSQTYVWLMFYTLLQSTFALYLLGFGIH